jgi:hypothetical protein
MAGYKKALIVVHRNESADDFQHIARRIRKLDPSIGVTMVSDFLTSKMVPPEYLNLPMLVIYLCNPPPSEFKVATKLAVKEMSKVEEYAHFKEHQIPCLPIERFKWGMELDQSIYGEWVVLKPENKTSTGRDINMVPTKLLPTLRLADFPENHLIREDSYLVQKLLKTGTHPKHCRATIFLDEVIYSANGRLNFPYPPEDSDIKALLNISVASNQHARRTAEMVKDPEVNELALKVAKTLPQNPLMAIDILRDEETGKLYVLELNLGGNVWHFSSKMVRNLPGYDSAARKKLVLQYNAWDRAAEALVSKTHKLAS